MSQGIHRNSLLRIKTNNIDNCTCRWRMQIISLRGRVYRNFLGGGGVIDNFTLVVYRIYNVGVIKLS